MLLFTGSGDYTHSYSFRILDAGAAPLLTLDTPVTNVMTTGYGAVLFQLPLLTNLRLLYDDLGAPDGCGSHAIYGPENQALTGAPSLGSDMEFTPTETGTGLLVLSSVCTNVPYSFQLVPGNHAPVLAAIPNRSIVEKFAFSFTATASDLEVPNDVLTWSMDAGAPTNATIDPATGLFAWTPTEAQGPSTNTITIRVRDDGTPSFADFKTFTLTVNESNEPPVLTLPANQTVMELAPLSLTATATDPDLPTNTLTFALVSGPANLTVSPAGAINWTPNEAQGPSTNTVTISVTDTNPWAVNATSLSVTNSFQIVVTESNSPPVLTLPPNTNINELAAYSATATATDPDVPANPLTFALVSGPGGLTVSSGGNISWTPNETQGPSTDTVTISVTDTNAYAINAKSLSVTNSYQIIVNEVNSAPAVGALSNYTVNAGQTISFTATATDSDLPANTLTFSLVSPPAGAGITSGGLFNWRPTVAQANSTNPVKIKVTDNGTPNLSGTNSFTVIVNPLAATTLSAVSYTNSRFTLRVSGTTGPDYIVSGSTNLFQWIDLFTNLSPAMPFQYTDTNGSALRDRFYRVRLSP